MSWIRVKLSVVFLFLTFQSVFGFEAKVDDLIYRFHTFKNFHGNVLIKQGDIVLYEKSVGLAQVEWNISHNKNSRFMIASLSKSFSASLILLLEEEGKLNINDFVAQYVKLPEKSQVNLNYWKKLKIKHLMNHTSGFKRDFRSTGLKHRSSFSNMASDVITPSFQQEDPFISEPGERFYYSNYGYVLLAHLIESVSQKMYEDILKIKILMPLKLRATGEYHRMKKITFMSDGYFYNEDERLRKRCCDDATSLRGAAGLYSSASDLMLWLETLISNQSVISNQSLLTRLMSDLVPSDFDNSFYGHGLIQDNVGSLKRIHHSGHEYGYVSSMSYFPESDLKIIILSNRQSLLANNEANELAEQISLAIHLD